MSRGTQRVVMSELARRAFVRQPRVAAKRSVAATLGLEATNFVNPKRQRREAFFLDELGYSQGLEYAKSQIPP